jgi:hypothetical protein
MKPEYNHEATTIMFQHIKETLERIEAQTIKTNGRVTKLENEQAGIMAKVGMGATIMASVVAAIIHKFI